MPEWQSHSSLLQVKVINNRLWDDKMYLYPLPQSGNQKNPKLEQNPGW